MVTLDGRALLALWSVDPTTGALEPLARRPIEDDAGFLQLGQHHRPTVQEAVARVGSTTLAARRRLAVGLHLLRDGLGAEVGTRALTAGAADHAARAEANLTGSPLRFWSRPGEGSSNVPTDLPFGIEPRSAPGLEGADLAIARGPDGSAHVGVVLGAPPRLLVYRWTPGRGFALRVVRGVGADLELERVP